MNEGDVKLMSSQYQVNIAHLSVSFWALHFYVNVIVLFQYSAGGFGAEIAPKRGYDVQSGDRSELRFLHEYILWGTYAAYVLSLESYSRWNNINEIKRKH